MSLVKNGALKKRTFKAVRGQQVTYYYGSNKQNPALSSIDITINEGVIYGLLGPSGCGKTTLLRCIIGRLNPKSGTIKVYGRRPGEPGFHIPGRGVGYMPQETALYPDITIEETLTYFGSLNLMTKRNINERVSFLLNFLEIPAQNKLIKNLSGGEKRRVSFASSLIHLPPLLILDEPTVGVDPLLRRSIWNHLRDLAKTRHMTIIITTHYVEEARESDMVGLIRNGNILTEMNPELLIMKYHAKSLEDVFWILCNSTSKIKDTEGCLSTCYENVGYEGSHEELNRVKVINRSCLQGLQGVTADKPDNKDINLEICKKSSYCSRLNDSRRRMATLLKKNFLRLKRNIPFAFFQVIVPALQVIVFCFCIGREPFDLPIGIVNNENSTTNTDNFSQIFLSKISNHTFKQKFFRNLSSAVEAVESGKIWGTVFIGDNFTSSLINRFLQCNDVDNKTIDDSEVKLYFDMTNQQISITMFNSIMKSSQEFAEEMLSTGGLNPRHAEGLTVLQDPVYGKINGSFTEFMAPGIILAIIYIMAVGLTAMSIIIEKKEGLLDRSWVSGVSACEVMFTISFSLFVTMVLQIVMVLIVTFFAFDLPMKGAVFWIATCVMFSGTSGMAYGIFISSICDEENIAMMIAMGSFFPNLLLSGIIWPVEAMNYYLRYISYCLPLTLLADTMRSLMSRGWKITENNLWIGCVVPLAWTIIFILIAGLVFKRRK